MNNVTWHRGIGTDIDSTMTLDQQLEKSGLNWNVGTSPVRYSGQNLNYYSDYRKAVYREDTGLLLDCAGKNWEPFQNREIVKIFHDFCNASGLSLDHLGYLDEGRTIFASADLKATHDINEVGDLVKGRVILLNYHSVGKGLQVRLQCERLICTNGMTQPITIGAKPITHVGELSTYRIERLLQGAVDTFNNFGRNAEKLAQTTITIPEATLLLIKTFGNPDKSVDDQPSIVAKCLRLFEHDAKGGDMLTAYHTAWGLLNAVTEFYNHHSQIRGGASSHLNSLLTGSKAARQQNFMVQLLRVTA